MRAGLLLSWSSIVRTSIVAWTVASFVVVSGLSLAACASHPAPEAPRRLAVEPPPAPAEEPKWNGALERGAVDRAIKGGLGRFLAHVEMRAVVEKGKFVGWSIVALHPQGAWEGVGLQPGDVVTRVNGMPIGRDDEAKTAFESLAVASEVRVAFLRDGKPQELRIAIVADDAPTAASAANP